MIRQIRPPQPQDPIRPMSGGQRFAAIAALDLAGLILIGGISICVWGIIKFVWGLA